MSIKQGCVVETIEAANKIGNPVRPAIEAIYEAIEKHDSGVFAIACERCGVELSISTELGNDGAQLMLFKLPATTEEVCDAAKYRKNGDWVTNMSKRWFNVSLLDTPEEDISDKVGPSISQLGLDIALDDAAHNAAMAHQIEYKRTPLRDAHEVERLKGMATSTVNVLDLVLVRPDGKTWQEEVNKRAVEIE